MKNSGENTGEGRLRLKYQHVTRPNQGISLGRGKCLGTRSTLLTNEQEQYKSYGSDIVHYMMVSFQKVLLPNVFYRVRTGPEILENPGKFLKPWKSLEKPWNFFVKPWKISQNFIEKINWCNWCSLSISLQV